MSKKLLLFLIALALPMVSVAGTQNSPKTNVVVSPYDDVQNVLEKIPFPEDLSANIKQLYLSAQIERKKGNIRAAIRFYRKVLDKRPSFVRARFELALCYMASDRWDRADYYLRSAMASEGLPNDVKHVMEEYRALVRRNKHWDFWFEFGDVPNVRSSIVDNDECIGGTCEKLTELKNVSGVNLAAGADYEFKLSDNWRWKNDVAFETNLYKENKYNDLSLAGSTGPRYVWDDGDIWFAGVVGRSWYSQKPLGWSYGAKIDANYDLTRRLSSGLILMGLNNSYDEYNDLLGGQTYTAVPHFTYYIDSTKYIELLGEVGRETAKMDFLANYNYGIGLSFGTEMPYGFLVSLEPYLYWVDYDAEREIEKSDSTRQRIKQRDFIQKCTLSLINTNIELLGFMPVFKVTYINKESNVPAPAYDKWVFGIGIKRKF